LDKSGVEESSCRDQALNQKTEARPAIRECREQSLQEASRRQGKARATPQEARKGETYFILSGDLECNDSALEGNGDGVGPIAGAKL
jgi:hypothetical protein